MEKESKKDDRQSNASDVETPAQQAMPSIFSREEVAATIRSFVLAWIKNDVKIHFPTADEIHYNAKKDGTKMEYAEAHQREVHGKTEFLNKIAYLSGTVPATKQQQEYVITELFKDILSYRCGDRVEGTFGKKEEYDVRLSQIEEQIEAMNNSIQQLIIWYRSMLGH